MATTIFYFTGTGNSLKVAKDIAASLGDTDLVQISRKNLEKAATTCEGPVGFVFPVYYGGLPHMVREFAGRLRIGPSSYVFAVATYGGAAGIAFQQLGGALLQNGSRLHACFGVAMPGNCQVLYPPNPEKKQQERFSAEADSVAAIARRVREMEEVPCKRPNALVAWFFSLMYGRLKPTDRDRHFWTDDRCSGCGTCTRICPAGNITLEDERPRWHQQCEFCLACMQWCPQEAIQYDRKTITRGRYHHPDIRVAELFQEK